MALAMAAGSNRPETSSAIKSKEQKNRQQLRISFMVFTVTPGSRREYLREVLDI
jgi:hypothetical protein